MLERTVYGKDVWFTKMPDGTYLVLLEGEFEIVNQKPITDQDLDRIESEYTSDRELLEIYQSLLRDLRQFADLSGFPI